MTALNPQDRSVIEQIWSHNLSLIQVWESYKLLNLSESIGLPEAIERFLLCLKKSGRSKRYVSEMSYVLRKLDSLTPSGQTCYQVTTKTLWTVLDSAGFKDTARRKVGVFLNWCHREGIIPARITVPGKPSNPDQIGILTNGQVRSLLDNCGQDLLGHIWLCLCMGLRVAEARRVDHLEFRDGFLVVGAKASKTRSRRVIQALAGHERYADMIRLQTNLRKRMESLRKTAGILDWPRNCMRHTAASHWLNFYQDEQKAALHLGHSPVMLHRHYKALVTRKETEDFFALW